MHGAFVPLPLCARFGEAFRCDPPISDFTYAGTELDAVAGAANYYRWIIDSFAPAIGRRIVEAGAGIGTVSELLLQHASPEAMVLIEPDRQNIAELHRRFDNDRRVQVQYGYLEGMSESFGADTIVAVNVLEHVERPGEFLDAAWRVMAPGGALLLLVPAIPALYNSLDKAFDHFRRYTRSELRNALATAGFRIETLHYLNFVGVAAWFVSGQIMRRKTLSRSQVTFYDRLVIPWVRRLESVVRPPIGQSLLVVARKA